LDLYDIPKPLIDGHVVDEKGNIIGFCRGYNPRGHFAEKVMLFAYPDDAEGGSLDPSCKVVPANNPIIFGDMIPKKDKEEELNKESTNQFSSDEDSDLD
jgi:hypothetical protein